VCFHTAGSLPTVSSGLNDEELGQDSGGEEEKEDASGNGGNAQ